MIRGQEFNRPPAPTKALIASSLAQQKGQGKGDAVRLGFDLATKDILMILDADLTTPPEELPKFYNAIARKQSGVR